jgi:hypothetical protein
VLKRKRGGVLNDEKGENKKRRKSRLRGYLPGSGRGFAIGADMVYPF